MTRTVDGKPSNLASGVVRGTVTRTADRVLFTELDVVLDTIDSSEVLGTPPPAVLSVGE